MQTRTPRHQMRAGQSSSEGAAPPPVRHRVTRDLRTKEVPPCARTAPKPGDITREWLVIDATDVVLGRLAVQTANLLRGKHKAIFAPQR